MKRILAVLCVAALLVGMVFGTQTFFRSKAQEAKYSDYFDAPESYDVIFVGSSHVIMGLLPMELWKQEHISTYNLANYNQSLQADYWMLRMLFDNRRPKLVVVDPYPIVTDHIFTDRNSEMMHGMMDQFPNSKLKREAIRDLMDGELQKEYLYPLSYSHSFWEKIDRKNFADAKENYFYGAGSDESAFYGTPSQMIVRPYRTLGPLDSTEIDRTETVGKSYLRKIIELCRETDTDLLFALTPFLPYDDEMKWINAIRELSEEYDVPLLDGVQLRLIDPMTDLFDYGHLNSSGARKWSKVVGRYLAENYDLPVYSSGAVFEQWERLYAEKYLPYKLKRIKEQSNLYNYLMLLRDEDLSVCLYLPEGSELFHDAEGLALISNLSDALSLSADVDHSPFRCVIDNAEGKVFSGAFPVDTSFGRVDFDGAALRINEEPVADWNDIPYYSAPHYALGVLVIDNRSGEIADQAVFYKNDRGVYVK